MANEKDYNKRLPVSPEKESPTHKKKSKTASQSVSGKRSDHKHDYEQVIIESGLSSEYYWAKRCRICGRVDDKGEFKAEATEGLIKERKTVQLDANAYTFSVFYSLPELRKKFPRTAVLKFNYSRKEYEEVER